MYILLPECLQLDFIVLDLERFTVGVIGWDAHAHTKPKTKANAAIDRLFFGLFSEILQSSQGEMLQHNPQ